MTAPYRNRWSAGAVIAANYIVEPNVLMFGYKCTTAGTTGSAEPVWPQVAGGTVVDGTVVWTAYAADTITWTAEALYTSGAGEPAWPQVLDSTVLDGSVTWTARSAAITDPKCPQSKVAVKMAEKIFSPYRDVVRYCVTDYPRDWSTPDDAGFLATGLQSSESPEVVCLGEYRGRLVCATPSDMQVWTVDPDPAEMSLFDNIPGLGSMHPRAVVPVAGDLYFLTMLGVRSVTVAAGATNLAAGDVGTVIDPLVQAKLAGPIEPHGCYYPGSGQYWLFFGNEAFVNSRTQTGKLATWTRYIYPFDIDSTFQLDNELYFRAGDNLYRVDESATDDDGTPFEGLVWTPYLENGVMGTTKMLDSFDIVAYGDCTVSFGYDQNNAAAYTAEYQVSPDTTLGGRIPMPLAAPSLAVKLRFLPNQAWQLNAMTLYVNDFRPGL